MSGELLPEGLHYGVWCCLSLFPLQVWNAVDSGHCLQTYSVHSEAVRAARWSPCGRRILSGGFDFALHLTDLETGVSWYLTCPRSAGSPLTGEASPEGPDCKQPLVMVWQGPHNGLISPTGMQIICQRHHSCLQSIGISPVPVSEGQSQGCLSTKL